MPAAARPVARLTSPGEIVAVVPVLCGFAPLESLVVLSLRGPRRRVGLTMRFDLEQLAADPCSLLDEVAGRLAHDGATEALLVVWTETADSAAGLAHRALVVQLVGRVEAAGVTVQEALLARAGRWWSYRCEAQCCPPGGTPVPGPENRAVQAVEAAGVLDGRAVLPSREHLRASVAAPVLQAAAAAEQHLGKAVAARLERVAGRGVEQERRLGLALVDDLLRRAPGPVCVGGAEAARLAVAVADVRVRDAVATRALDRPEALLALLQQAVRQVVAPDDAPLCALLAWVAYAAGDGGLANVALERCLASDPGYSMGHLLAQALHQQVAPADIRALLRQTCQSPSARPQPLSGPGRSTG